MVAAFGQRTHGLITGTVLQGLDMESVRIILGRSGD